MNNIKDVWNVIKNLFEKAAPEAAGINSERIISFIKRLEKAEIDMHSILIMKDDKLICEVYYSPFEKDTLHRMFSVTKSVVSLCIGILCDEGRIELGDSITKYFPEYEPEGGFHPYLCETTIRDMLMMNTPHMGTTFDKHKMDDWVRTYFVKKPSHRPGTIFSYDTSASHVLAALAEKLSGMSLLDFLRSKGLSELGFSGKAYCLTDGCGVSQGGSGMMALPLDLLVLANLVIKRGSVGGRRIVSEEYLSNALSFKSPTFVKGSFPAESQGYGYQFWRVRENGFMMYGMAGQLAVCFPERNLVLVTTADTTDRKDGIQQIFDAFIDEIFSHLDEENYYRIDTYTELCGIEENSSLRPLMNFETYDMNQTFYFDDGNALGLKSIRIITSRSGGKIIISNLSGKQVIKFGFGSFMDGKFTAYNCPYTASGTWIGADMLVIKVNLIGEYLGKVMVQLSFRKKGSLTAFFRKTEEVMFNEYSGCAQSISV